MKVFIQTMILMLLVATIGFTSCKKGDAGPQGPQGEQGPKGDKGDKGATGTANVFSKTFTSGAITWTNLNEYSTNYKIADLSIPQITSTIATSGAVFVYAGLIFAGQTWTALPASWLELGVTKYFSFGVKTGGVRVRYSMSNNSVPGLPSIPVKVVFMSAAAVSLAKQKKIDLANYTAVKEAFHLND